MKDEYGSIFSACRLKHTGMNREVKTMEISQILLYTVNVAWITKEEILGIQG